MLRHALALQSRGVAIFPCRQRSKLPATAHGCLDATTDPAQAHEWWGVNPDLNIAIATGKPSGIFALDVDFPNGEAALRKLEARYGKLTPTVETNTGGGGRHAIYRMPDCDIRNSASKVGDRLDIRGTGGFIVVPPSVHPSGRRYEWSVDGTNACADAPAWLVTLATNGGTGDGNGHTPTDWLTAFAADVHEGKRDETLTSFAGHLLRRYVAPPVVYALLESWNATHCIPPLPTADIERIVLSIIGREETRRGGGPKWLTIT